MKVFIHDGSGLTCIGHHSDFEYASREDAERDAASMARQSPGRTFTVFVAVTSFRANPNEIPVRQLQLDKEPEVGT